MLLKRQEISKRVKLMFHTGREGGREGVCKMIKLGKNSNLVGFQRNSSNQIPYGLSFTLLC